jgi:hypothetical protein
MLKDPLERAVEMSFLCPKCSNRSMNIVSSIELPPDSRSDEIAIQITKCSQCSFVELAIYEESRRGALDSESVDHRGYYVKTTTLTSLLNRISRCPEPRNPRCKCSVHSTLNSVNAFGRWNWLDSISNMGTFRVR